jgi:gliding motility-associated-like protein
MKKHHTFPIDMLTKFAQTVFFVFSFFVLSAQTDQRYYWVGGGTNNEWGTIENWSNVSGGMPAAGITTAPTNVNTVIFDQNSFLDEDSSIVINGAVQCDSLLCLNSLHLPYFAASSGASLTINGSMLLRQFMTMALTLNFNSNRPNETIRSNGVTIGNWNSIYFNGTATYTLLDSTRFHNYVYINSGILNTDGNYVSSGRIHIQNTGSIHFANSIIELTGNQNCWNNSSSNFITAANSNGSLIRFTDFYNPTGLKLYANTADIYNNIEIASGQIYYGTYNKITFLGSGSIFYNVTIDTLIVNDISTFTLDNSTTINEFLQGKLSTPCGGQWALNGSGSGQVTLGNNAIVDIERALIKDLGFSASVTAANSVDLGNNSNIIFTAPAVKKTLYWIGETGNWNDAMKWSLTSGGVPANCVPTVFDNVIFDNNSFSAPNQTVTVDLTAFCDSMSWIGTNNFNPQFVGGSTVTTEIYGSLVLQTGMQFVNTINFNSNRPNETIRSNGATIGYWNSIRFNGTATYTLLDSTRFSYSVDINSGILNTNGNYVSSEIINILNTGSIHFANSIIEITGTSYYCWNNSSSNLITAANSNGSLIRFTVYSPTKPMLYANSADIYNNIEIASGLIYRGTYNKITFLGSGGIFYNVTTDTLVLTAPANMIYTFSDTVRVKEGAYLSGTPCVQIYLQSNSETTPAIFDIKSQAANFSDDTLLIDHVYLHGIQALQGSDNAKLKKGSHSPDINQSGANWGYGIGTNNYNSGFAAMLPYNSGGSTYFGDDRVVPCGSFPHTLYSDNFLPSYGATFEWRRDSLTTPIIAETPDYAVTDSGTYYLTVNYGNGCQATDDVEFTVLSIDSISETICYGTTYSGWNLTDLDTEGFYTSRYKNAAGCDSLVYLTLSIRPSVDTTSLSATICRGDTLHYNGYALFDPNFQFSTFSFQLANVYGCDSMIKFNLSYHPYIDTTHITAEICQGSTYVLNGFNVSAEGVHLLTVQNSNGCDSTLKLTLSFTNLLKDTITAAICQGEQYTLNGFNENTAGAYNLMSQAADGCDSLTTLILTVKSHSLFAIDTAICKRETVQFFGQNLTEEGTYSHTLTNAAGCDSTVSITITHKPALYTQLDTAICASETVSFFGRQLTETGVYSETRDSYRGCDSTIELTLTVWAIPNISFEAIPAVVALRAGGEIFFLNHTDSAFLNNPDYRFTWNFGDDSAEENLIFSPTHTYSDWGDFIVTFSIDHSLNCHAEASITVTVEEMLEFPNIITPNGDGKNDVFAIINLNTAIDANDPNHYRENLLTIYNRWGKKVYEAKNYDTFMKGEELLTGTKSFSGQNCPDGTYYFTFYYKGKLEIYHLNGTLMIVRRVINN